MESLPLGNQTAEDYRLHVEKAESFPGSKAEYSIKHQVSGGNPKQKISKLMTSFFHGKFKKYSATLGGQSYILKVKEKEFEELPVVEHLCNPMARALRELMN